MKPATSYTKTFALLCLILATWPSRAVDWPQWRGPNRDGISKESGLLKQWPAEGPKLIWKLSDIGSGYSTPAVVRGRLYLLANDGLENEFVQALETKDGKRIWSTRLGNVGNPKQQPNFPAARSTPTVVGDTLYALGSDGDLACLELASGKVKWQKSLRNDFAGKPGTWAYAESPLVDGDTLVCTPGGSEATIVGLDRTTGQVRWKCATPEGDEAAYSISDRARFGRDPAIRATAAKGAGGCGGADRQALVALQQTDQRLQCKHSEPARQWQLYFCWIRWNGGRCGADPRQGRQL